MTRMKAGMIAAGVTATVVLLVLAAGASFGQFGLGPDGGNRVQALGSDRSDQQADPDDAGPQDWDDDEGGDEVDEGDDSRGHDGDDDDEDDDEHEDEDEDEDDDEDDDEHEPEDD